ncbi:MULTISPECIES: hypothetical protein [Streptomyces]|uniref:hypothetical protein n=1 Tax=Streptomyces TaxID=1883 RepID=UPI001B342E0A|nr:MULTISPECIES: hypothetical protein [Streptomyces]MBP5896380.1 hypothetical protein [Streptomyces sp. LBUM 1481]MBP5926756.1 hypothetical protein [Streptomyces sp. LBUM 1483]MDX3298598.1 hypothetical protein [Streptomyces scabiei]MDX3672783.1 hypothetical protein [Streptomyces europaeiscabiei]
MTTSTITAPIGRNRIRRTALTETQVRFAIGHVLERLGSAHGLAEDNPAIPYTETAERLALSELAAWQLGLALTPGHEIAQCYDCADILDAVLTDEDAGIIRCHDCHGDHPTGEPPAVDLWADFYSH